MWLRWFNFALERPESLFLFEIGNILGVRDIDLVANGAQAPRDYPEYVTGMLRVTSRSLILFFKVDVSRYLLASFRIWDLTLLFRELNRVCALVLLLRQIQNTVILLEITHF